MVEDFELKDKFLDRLMIPISDLDENVVGFTGRIITENPNRPKYLNSPDSHWFKKGNLWFGLNSAKKSIIKNKKALVVEGNMDVLACHELGFPFAVASQGTSFTSFQIQILTRITKTIWLAFDNDNSGRIAAEKFFVESSRFGLQIWQVIIPSNYKDLDEFLHTLQTNFILENEKGENTFDKNNARVLGENLENSSKNLNQKSELNSQLNSQNQTKNTSQNVNQENSNKDSLQKFIIKSFQVLPFLDYKLTQIAQNWTLQNSYEQNDQINRFLELTVWLKRLEVEQTLVKLANQTQFDKKILNEMRNEIIAKNSKFVGQIGTNSKQNLEIKKIGQKILQKPKKTINKEISISWQKLSSLYLAKKLELNLANKMESFFILLCNLVADFSEFETFDEYLAVNSDLLVFVFENLNKENLLLEQNQHKTAIKNFLSNKINLIPAGSNLIKHFDICMKN